MERAKANSNIPKLGYAQKPKKSYLTNINLKKTLENIIYLGFDIKELSDLPGFIEAPQLLVSLSSKMGLKVMTIEK